MKREADGTPLFAWQPVAKVIVFPMIKRVGKIRTTAANMLAKSTDRHAEFYRDQVTTALLKQMAKAGILEAEQDEQLGAFWSAVQVEIIRLAYRGSQPGGTAA
ncbi:DUF6074 family protein [Mesorhizobium sp. PAMC28654]|uniref:DUF6074 family protein n=1 Tax=Mesorhizobium sp. PAMC28654 TaxID=2880934 RepID=UPI001D0A93D7|nr:DUF6074 family protein [Mesorhizobium sp. PAMC28654]UDL87041.1 DUF6074 family protein [Mesorhizobium sp. PAMC28654]